MTCIIYYFPHYDVGSSNYITFFPFSSLKPTPVSLSGATYGLDLELSVDSMDSVLRGLTKAAGVNLVIHEAGMYPLTNSKVKKTMYFHGTESNMSRFQSRSLSPNTMTKLVLSRQTMHREPEPYPSKCISKWEKEYQVYLNIFLS